MPIPQGLWEPYFYPKTNDPVTRQDGMRAVLEEHLRRLLAYKDPSPAADREGESDRGEVVLSLTCDAACVGGIHRRFSRKPGSRRGSTGG